MRCHKILRSWNLQTLFLNTLCFSVRVRSLFITPVFIRSIEFIEPIECKTMSVFFVLCVSFHLLDSFSLNREINLIAKSESASYFIVWCNIKCVETIASLIHYKFLNLLAFRKKEEPVNFKLLTIIWCMYFFLVKIDVYSTFLWLFYMFHLSTLSFYLASVW